MIMSGFLGVFIIFFALSAQAATYKINGDVIGEVTKYTVEPEDNFYSIARKYDLGITEMLAANPNIDPWVPEVGSILQLPTVHILPPKIRKGMVINLAELRLFYFFDNKTVMTFPIGIGREGWRTPVGKTKIALKRKNPVWIPPASIREVKPDLPQSVPAGPDNPMGMYALNLAIPELAIHGTNRPHAIGTRSSHGCIRMYPEDIETLFNLVKTGTPVEITDEVYKLGWQDKTLFLEVIPSQEQSDDILDYKPTEKLDLPHIYTDIAKLAGDKSEIDTSIVDAAIASHNGIPVAIFSK
jgi:L,D-transpeptidase ErfK/SrfK